MSAARPLQQGTSTGGSIRVPMDLEIALVEVASDWLKQGG